MANPVPRGSGNSGGQRPQRQSGSTGNPARRPAPKPGAQRPAAPGGAKPAPRGQRPAASAQRPARPAGASGQQRPATPKRPQAGSTATKRRPAAAPGRGPATKRRPANTRARGTARQVQGDNHDEQNEDGPRRPVKVFKPMPWIIMGSLTAVVIVIFVYMYFFPAHDLPTSQTLKPGYLDVIAPSLNLAEYGVQTPSGGGNAADCYQKIIRKFDMDTFDKADDFQRTIQRNWEGPFVAIDKKKRLSVLSIQDEKILRNCALVYNTLNSSKRNGAFYTKNFDYFASAANNQSMKDDWGRYGMIPRGTKAITNIDTIVKLYGVHLSCSSDPEVHKKGIEVLKKRLIIGWHLMNSRNRMRMRYVGMETIQLAAWEVAQRSQNQAEREKFQKLADKAKTWCTDYQGKLALIRSLNTKNGGTYLGVKPGDLFNIAENDKDPAVRAEAILLLGFLYHTSDHRGNNIYIKKLLKKFSSSNIPVVKKAAEAAVKAKKGEDFIS